MMRKLFKSKKGFTLVELIVVMVIIVILAAALVTSLIGYIQKAQNSNALIEGNNIYVAAQSYVSENLGTGKITSVSPDDAAMITTIQNYVGMDKIGKINVLEAGANGTITSFKYTSTNNKIVTYTSADGWSVSNA